MFLQPAGTIRLRHGRFSQGFAKRDEEAITALYRDNGFRDCKVTARSVDDFQGKPGNVAVTMEIDEGPQYTVGKMDVQGLNRPDRGALLAGLRFPARTTVQRSQRGARPGRDPQGLPIRRLSRCDVRLEALRGGGRVTR